MTGRRRSAVHLFRSEAPFSNFTDRAPGPCSGAGGRLQQAGAGPDDSPTAPGGPRLQGPRSCMTLIGASDASGVGSSVFCPPIVDCPNGMGYAPGRRAPASGARLRRLVDEPGYPDRGHQPRLPGARPAVRPVHPRQFHRAGNAARPRQRDAGDDFRGRERGQHDYRGARAAAPARAIRPATSTPR